MRQRTLLVPVMGLLILGAGGAAWWAWRDHRTEIARMAERERERQERVRQREDRLREESARLIPPLLEGVYLGMRVADARRARPQAEPDPTARSADEPGLEHLEERFANGARAMYVFKRGRLERVQVLSLLPSTQAVPPHLAAMNEQYGSPTGIWDCPNTGGVPTRRFTWRFGETAVSDVFLIYGDRVSVTLYIAPSDVIERSLRISSCFPVRDREQIERFPVAAPEQMERAAPGG